MASSLEVPFLSSHAVHFAFCSVRERMGRARERMGKKDKEARRRTKRKDEER